MAHETGERRIAGREKMADETGERRIAGRGEMVDLIGERRIAGRGEMAYETRKRRIAGRGKMADETGERRIAGRWKMADGTEQKCIEKGIVHGTGKHACDGGRKCWNVDNFDVGICIFFFAYRFSSPTQSDTATSTFRDELRLDFSSLAFSSRPLPVGTSARLV